jgi:threonine synthase
MNSAFTPHYISTRGTPDAARPANFKDALLGGMAPDGGLYVPAQMADISPQLDELSALSYPALAYEILQPFIGDAIADDDLRAMLKETYKAPIFHHPDIAPLIQLDENLWLLELFHGPTLSFKDYALQLLGRLFDYVLKQRGARMTIVGATSGDTGSAAIEACRHCDNIDIIILHPHNRTSPIQRAQMTSTGADNVHNIALEGTFDDCQNLVKAMFADHDFARQIKLSAVNSINWARIMAQIVYYVSSSLSLGGHKGRPVSYSVPTGNFGNVYAGYCARKSGAPLDQLGISTNRNDILTRFFESGTMRKDGVQKSLSPSMDIEISSNFERYLFDLCGRDPDAVAARMTDFREKGAFSVSQNLFEKAKQDFHALRCDDAQTLEAMRHCYQKTGHIIDPHSAVALHGALEMQAREEASRGGSDMPMVALACAHPAKFPDAVQKALGRAPEIPERLQDVMEREETFDILLDDYQRVCAYVRERSRASS